MIRFQPDTLTQALTRFFDMVAPDANVYVEIAAPDIRLAAVVLLALAALVMWRRLGLGRGPTMAMLLVLLASAVVWLGTTGNGRYFIPLLLVVGPIAIGLLCLLPLSRGLKAAIAAGLVAGQLFVLSQQSPWHAWSWMDWTDAPYFSIELGPEEKSAVPTTYASVSTITYSLIAPQFPANARWINLASMGGTPADEARVGEFLRNAAAQGPIRLIAPSLSSAMLADGRPSAAVVKAFDQLIARRHLKISGDCRLLASKDLAKLEGRDEAGQPRKAGFWICPLAYEAQEPKALERLVPPPSVEEAYERLGALCPRFFPAGEKVTLRLADGWSRHYSSETRVYVLDNGQVWYKFWRSLNPVQVGTITSLKNGEATIDCAQVRSGGAWRSGAQ